MAVDENIIVFSPKTPWVIFVVKNTPDMHDSRFLALDARDPEGVTVFLRCANTSEEAVSKTVELVRQDGFDGNFAVYAANLSMLVKDYNSMKDTVEILSDYFKNRPDEDEPEYFNDDYEPD